jgi:hypothetical protein
MDFSKMVLDFETCISPPLTSVLKPALFLLDFGRCNSDKKRRSLQFIAVDVDGSLHRAVWQQTSGAKLTLLEFSKMVPEFERCMMPPWTRVPRAASFLLDLADVTQ